MRAISWSARVLLVFALLQFAAIPLPTAYAEVTSDLVAEVVTRVKSSVVQIITVRRPAADDAKPDSEISKATSSERSSTAIASGFVVDPKGFIATNKHVIENAVSVFVVTSDGVRYKAQVVGMTYRADMAMLKIDAYHILPAVSFGDSDKVRVGETVIVIGSPFGFDGSVTTGIVSAVNRDIMESPFDDYIQSDASINHGDSGGPMFNLAGEVIGMNSVLFAPGTVGGSIGLGFAIPSNDLRFVLERIKMTGAVNAGMLPIRTQPVSWMIAQAIGAPSLAGALVAALDTNGDKMMAGQISPGDVILSFNGQAVLDPRDLARKAAATTVGSDAALEIYRGGERRLVHVKVQAWPEAKPPVTSSSIARFLGLALVPGSQNGVVVASVDPDGTAADSGIRKGDIILQVQQETVSDPTQALRIMEVQSALKRPYAAVLMERDGQRTWLPVAVPE